MHDPNRRLDAGSRLPLAPGLVCTGLACAGLLAASLVPSAARAACTPTSPANDATVTCSGTDSTGYDGSGADNLTISTTGAAILDDSSPTLDAAILVDDDSTVTIGAAATVRVTEQNGAGIRGDDDNFIDNKGRIELNANDTRGIAIDQNTTGVLPNGAVNSATGVIQVVGDRSYAIETGNNTGVATSGTINLIGDETRGLSGGSRLDYTKPANVTNSGLINIEGDDAFGMKFGDGWLDGSFQDTDNNPNTATVFVPTAAGIRNQGDGTINVTGDRSTGIFAGDTANTDGDHDSFVLNAGTISVTGTDSIGVSVGGNGRLDRYDLSTFNLNNSNTLGLVTVNNSGEITGDADSGPLVVFRDFNAGHENRLLIGGGGSIVADLTNQGTADRAIAIRGTDGDEFIVNVGQVQGDVELGGGDDRWLQLSGAQQSGNLIGGAGQDELTLVGTRTAADTFDVGNLQGFEAIRIARGAPITQSSTTTTPWRLTNTSGFTGLVEVQNDGILDVPTPITLGGALDVQSRGTIQVTLDGTTPPLTVQGATSLDGNLVVRKGANLTPSATPYRVILANGGVTGQFASIRFPDASGTRIFTSSYDTLGVLALFQDVGLVGVARNANQRAIAQSLFDLTNSNGNQDDLQAVLDGLNDIQNLASVYDALSPEAYDAQTTVSVEAGRRIAAMLFDRPRECRTGERDPWTGNPNALPCHARRLSPWAAGLGSFRRRDAFSGHARYDAQMGGIIAGVDFQPVSNLDFTLAVSGQRGGIDVARAGESTLTLAEVTGAAALNLGGLRLQGAATYGHGFHQDRRQIQFDGPTPTTGINVRGTDDHESDRTLLATEIGYRVPAGPVGVEPIFGFDWAWMSQDGIREADAGGFGLDVESRDDEIGSLRAGVRLSTVYDHKTYLGPWLEWMTGVWRPTFDVAWRQFVEGNERDVAARLQGGADTAGGFEIQGKEDPGGAEIGLGLRLIPTDANRLRLDLRYQAYVAEHTLEQDLVAQATIAF
ncbi:MAG: autotransporter domain-containing protein [Deltaproteobacteria bacterium]|nr:autotransporter domain-containing protein [Deltaproteobacteria bacterium]